MGGHGRVPHKWRFLARIGRNRNRTHFVIGTICGEDESRLGVRKLARDKPSKKRRLVRSASEHHGRGIAREARGRKSIDLKDAQCACSRKTIVWFAGEFLARPGPLHVSYTS